MDKRHIFLGSGALVVGLAAVWFSQIKPQPASQEHLNAAASSPADQTTRQLRSSDTKPQNRFTALTDNSRRWQVRVDMLRRLDASTLNQSEIDYLYGLLSHQVPAQQQEAWWVVMNEVMEQLQKQRIAPQRFEREMLRLVQDTSLDEVTRDYAVQHLCISLGHPRVDNPQQAAARIVPVLVEVLQTPSALHSSIAGTTLMALVDAAGTSEVQPVVDDAFLALEPTLMPIITAETTSTLSTRTSAINAVGMLGLTHYMPAIRHIIQKDTVNDSARLSAIAALGAYYQSPIHTTLPTSYQSDLLLLQQIAGSPTKFKHAATAALHKLSK